mmetsp:Transcript_11334/g.34538  ORF Transcript_11334/g.34538 Transcript_11334/m.34538 type:complete len:425 (+) Transcript_11334:365-1639(+)
MLSQDPTFSSARVRASVLEGEGRPWALGLVPIVWSFSLRPALLAVHLVVPFQGCHGGLSGLQQRRCPTATLAQRVVDRHRLGDHGVGVAQVLRQHDRVGLLGELLKGGDVLLGYFELDRALSSLGPHRLGHRPDPLRGGVRQPQDRLGLSARLVHHLPGLGLGRQDLGLFLSLGLVDRTLLLSLGLQNRGPLPPLRLRLQLHRRLHAEGRGDVPDLVPKALQSPSGARLVDASDDLDVQGVPLLEGLVQGYFSDLAPHGGLGEHLHRVQGVLHPVRRLVGVHHPDIQNSVDGHRNVIPRDGVLVWNIQSLLLEVVHVPYAVYNRNKDVDAAVEDAAEFSEALDHPRLLLRHDLDHGICREVHSVPVSYEAGWNPVGSTRGGLRAAEEEPHAGRVGCGARGDSGLKAGQAPQPRRERSPADPQRS